MPTQQEHTATRPAPQPAEVDPLIELIARVARQELLAEQENRHADQK